MPLSTSDQVPTQQQLYDAASYLKNPNCIFGPLESQVEKLNNTLREILKDDDFWLAGYGQTLNLEISAKEDGSYQLKVSPSTKKILGGVNPRTDRSIWGFSDSYDTTPKIIPISKEDIISFAHQQKLFELGISGNSPPQNKSEIKTSSEDTNEDTEKNPPPPMFQFSLESYKEMQIRRGGLIKEIVKKPPAKPD